MHGMEELIYIYIYIYHFKSDSFPSILPIISNSIRQAAVACYQKEKKRKQGVKGLILWSSVYDLFFVVLCCSSCQCVCETSVGSHFSPQNFITQFFVSFHILDTWNAILQSPERKSNKSKGNPNSFIFRLKSLIRISCTASNDTQRYAFISTLHVCDATG